MNLDDDAVAAVQRAFSAMHAEMVKIGAALGRAMADFMASPQGQYLKAVVDYYDRHPEELDAMIAAREAEGRRRDCHCLCQRWDHLGSCTGAATTERVFTAAELGATTVPLCAACAESIRLRSGRCLDDQP